MTDAQRQFAQAIRQDPDLRRCFYTVLGELEAEAVTVCLHVAADWEGVCTARGAIAVLTQLKTFPDKEIRDARARKDYDDRTSRAAG